MVAPPFRSRHIPRRSHRLSRLVSLRLRRDATRRSGDSDPAAAALHRADRAAADGPPIAPQSQTPKTLERGIEERPELLRSRRMPQLAQGLRFDLTDALARDVERAADFLERMLGSVAHAKSHLEHLLLARRPRAEDLVGLLFQIRDDDVIDRGDHAAILDEIAKMRIFLFADRRLE